MSEQFSELTASPDIIELVKRCTEELAEQEELELPGQTDLETVLFGKRGILDSVGLVTLLVSVEEAIEDRLGFSISLADQRAMSQQNSPFRSVGALATYATRLVEEARGSAELRPSA